MSITSKQAETELGKKSLAVRTKLMDRTVKCEEVARRGQATLAQVVVHSVVLPHQIYIESSDGP